MISPKFIPQFYPFLTIFSAGPCLDWSQRDCNHGNFSFFIKTYRSTDSTIREKGLLDIRIQWWETNDKGYTKQRVKLEYLPFFMKIFDRVPYWGMISLHPDYFSSTVVCAPCTRNVHATQHVLSVWPASQSHPWSCLVNADTNTCNDFFRRILCIATVDVVVSVIVVIALAVSIVLTAASFILVALLVLLVNIG